MQRRLQGQRYNRETLEVRFKETIADVLDMTVEEGAEFFSGAIIRDKLVTLERVGLGYVKIGQQATTLSGGEAQRVKLAKELSRRASLYILDEPTTGLHFEDVRKLLDDSALVDQGNTAVVIEHNLEVIKTADWIIDLGPEGAGGSHVWPPARPKRWPKTKPASPVAIWPPTWDWRVRKVEKRLEVAAKPAARYVRRR